MASNPDLEANQFGDEDRRYAGSRFSDVVKALFANPYQRVWGGAGEPPLPVYETTLRSVFGGLVTFGPNPFSRASERTLDSGADLRWGPDGKGVRRLVHPNGMCLIGRWRITAQSDYTGYFAAGSEALAIGRYSTCCKETRRGYSRSLSLVGKLYPTADPNHAEPLTTANFMTQDDIGGSRVEYINDIELRNAPNITVGERGTGFGLLLRVGLTFGQVDQEGNMRQLYPIAELGKPAGTPTRAPEFMRLLVAANQPRIEGPNLDFRDEVMGQIFDRGDPTPKRTLAFDIEVTDQGTRGGSALSQRRTFTNWRRLGTLTFDNAVISRNADFAIHFRHPTWRTDRNDPGTATRVDGKKVRRS
jgi:hypothetical protein